MAKEITMNKLLGENDKYLIQAQAAAQCLMDSGAAIQYDANTVDGLTWLLYDRLEDLSRLSEKMQGQCVKDQAEAVKSSQAKKEEAPARGSQAHKWKVISSTPQDIDDLFITSRDSEGEVCWCDPPALNTDDPLAHEGIGRDCAHNLLELIHNTEKREELDKHAFSFVASEIVRQGHTINTGFYKGFFEMISEHLIAGTGTGDR